MAEPATQGDPSPRSDGDGGATSAGDSVAAIVQEARRYREIKLSRPPPLRIRSLRAYWVTFVVIGSYLLLRFRARFHDETWVVHALRATHLRNARRIEHAICELQGLFIKVGQLISIMTNFLPEEFRRELEGLQDAVPPRPYGDIAARVYEELKKTPPELFASFEERPIASASIGQVHLARLVDGTKVAVKVQYPAIEQVVHRDLNTLRRIFWIIGWFIPYQGLPELYREIRAIVMEELDYTAEAVNAERIAANFVGRHDVAFPRIVHDLSTSRVLTTALRDRLQDHRQARGQAARARPRPARAPGRRDLLPADLQRRRLSRRSAPGELARAAGCRGSATDDRVPRLRRGRRDPEPRPPGHDRAGPGRR